MGVVSCGTTVIDNGVVNVGAVNWDTTAKTTSFTAVSGTGYFVNTTSGAITVTLPAGSAGDIVGISDYASTFQTNNVTITPNGTDKINGVNQNATLSTQGIAVSLVYVDATRGWKSVTGSDDDTSGVTPFINATGGTITESGDYRIHTFTGPGTFTVSSLAPGPSGNPNTVDYLVTAGGGGAGGGIGGGGGAGGYRESSGNTGCYTSSPLATPTGITVTATDYPITVGAGGAGRCIGTSCGTRGSNSIFSTITSAGGGADTPGILPGGSGAGEGHRGGTGGTGNTPPVSPPQGQNGGNAPDPAGYAGAGGGGAIGAGTSTSGGGGSTAGPGGNGTTSSINGTPTARAGGGGGGQFLVPGIATGGTGGGGDGGDIPGGGQPGQNGTVNTGGGGGGGAHPCGDGGSGGSGIVIIRYKFQ